MKPASDHVSAHSEHQAQEQGQESRNKGCAAYGCPCTGSINTTGKWYCRYHHGQDVTQNDAITQILKINIAALHYLWSIERLSIVEFQQRREKMKAARFPLKSGETQQHYKNRIDAWLKDKIRQALKVKEGAA